MTTKINPRKDFVETAFAVFQQASGEVAQPVKPTKAQEDGRKGGLTGGKARSDKLTRNSAQILLRRLRLNGGQNHSGHATYLSPSGIGIT